MKSSLILITICGLIAVQTSGCSTAPKTAGARNVLNAEVDEALTIFKQRDPSIQRFFDSSYGYAVFPKVYKGAFWVGGAYGKGQVYEHAALVGYSSLSQATLGFSFGGEYFREIVFFSNKESLDDFIAREYAFSAQVAAVAATAGAAAKADYTYGMAVFIIAQKGLMVDVSVGGQKFNYTPASLVANP